MFPLLKRLKPIGLGTLAWTQWYARVELYYAPCGISIRNATQNRHSYIFPIFIFTPQPNANEQAALLENAKRILVVANVQL